MSELKYVYQHLDRNGVVFYIGCGKKSRPYTYKGRSKAWNKVAEFGYTVEVLDILPKEEALKLERDFIFDYGLESLTNKSKGVRSLKQRSLNNGYYKKSTRIEYDIFCEIKELAKKEDRSINGQINVLLKEALKARKKLKT